MNKKEINNKRQSNQSKINALLTEYQECFNNYIYRDQLAAHEFYLGIVIVTLLIGVISTTGDKLGNHGKIFIFIIGIIALVILHLDLMSTSSSKKAAIKRAKEIERKSHELNLDLQLANKIGSRDIYYLEKLFKNVTSSTLMIWFIRILIIIWIIYCILSIAGIIKTIEIPLDIP